MSEDEEISELPGGWINWFCSLEDHHFFCEVDEEFITDNFNLYGIKEKIQHYNEALQMLLSPEPPDEQIMENEKFLNTYQEASDLYGLIHARFITTPKGLAMMREKFLMGAFGQCPRILCEKQNVIPIGLTEELKIARVKVFCPKCEEVYAPKQKCQDIDGGFFGSSFPHLLLMTYPDIVPAKSQEKFVPKLYGFKIYKKNGSAFKEDDDSKEAQKDIKGLEEKAVSKIKQVHHQSHQQQKKALNNNINNSNQQN